MRIKNLASLLGVVTFGCRHFWVSSLLSVIPRFVLKIAVVLQHTLEEHLVGYLVVVQVPFCWKVCRQI